MKLFFIGDLTLNAGASNVNKELVKNLKDKDLLIVKSKNRFLKIIEYIFYTFMCDVILFSSLWESKILCKVAHLLNKKIIYLMHGCVNYESDLNGAYISKKTSDYEIDFLKKVDLIITVSEKYMNWVAERYPFTKDHIHYLNLGIDSENNVFCKKNKDITEIILSGGDRPQKNNLIICKAVDELVEENNLKLKVKVCGDKIIDNNIFLNFKNSKYIGKLSIENFYQELSNSNLYILNSELDSFGLSVIEAINHGCDVLISNNSGVTSILDVTENDLIINTKDLNEIKSKILYVIKNHNNERIKNKLDYEHYSWRNVSLRLYDICQAVYKNKNYADIK